MPWLSLTRRYHGICIRKGNICIRIRIGINFGISTAFIFIVYPRHPRLLGKRARVILLFGTGAVDWRFRSLLYMKGHGVDDVHTYIF